VIFEAAASFLHRQQHHLLPAFRYPESHRAAAAAEVVGLNPTWSTFINQVIYGIELSLF
jgi:hypothetical protein